MSVAPIMLSFSDADGSGWPQPPLAGLVETKNCGAVAPVKPDDDLGRISELVM